MWTMNEYTSAWTCGGWGDDQYQYKEEGWKTQGCGLPRPAPSDTRSPRTLALPTLPLHRGLPRLGKLWAC